jgi:membrane associated rhomboid family serine protease
MITIIIIIVSAIFSIIAFNRRDIFYKYQFNAYQIVHRKEWYRIITHAFLHANWEHLIINMLVFYSFGRNLEYIFASLWGGMDIILYVSLYFGAIIISSLYSLYKEKDNHYYNAVGASGAVAAVTFAFVFFNPLEKVWFFGLIPIPGILFALLYLGYSYYMSKRNVDNIGHDAHFYGAVFGFVFPLIIDIQSIHIFLSGFSNIF